ncbi:MAG: hypothetical protein KDA55_23455, partial [Planctomycetales bacterium]|nr:hypothetical protein [Planctomycetales bacterium]
ALMRRMVNAYHDMPRYRDEAMMVLSYRRNGQVERETAPMSVAAERPGRVSFSIYQTRMVCDGSRLRARISDPATADLDGQTLDLPAPERLSLPVLYGDPLLHAFLRDGLAGYPVQLELLFADAPLQPVMSQADAFELLGERTIDGHACRGVAARIDSGRFVFWIDTREYLLRRLELPADAMREALAGVDEIDQLQLTVEFTNATFPNSLPADAFRWSETDGDKSVGRFVLPASPLPTSRLGESVAAFDLVDLQGAKFSTEGLRGASAVMVWFNDHPASRAILEQIQQVARQVRGDGTHFVAVFADARGTTDQLRTLLAEWRIDLPASLDQSAVGRDRLSIQEAPTLVLLDANQRLQVFHPRANPDLASQLPQWLARLQAGEDLAAEAIQQHEADVARYRQELSAAMRLTDVVPVAAPAPEIAAAYPPRELKLTQVWQSTELTAPG